MEYRQPKPMNFKRGKNAQSSQTDGVRTVVFMTEHRTVAVGSARNSTLRLL